MTTLDTTPTSTPPDGSDLVGDELPARPRPPRPRRSPLGWVLWVIGALAAAAGVGALAPGIPLLPVAVLLAWPVLVDVVARPTFRRLALRNISRRKGEAVLVVLGSLLGTAIITASFVVGDTIEGSLRDDARTRLGPVDEVVRLPDLDGLDELAAVLADPPLPGTDGTLPLVSASAAVATPGPDPRAEPVAVLTEVDFDAARAFGSNEGATGMGPAGPTPSGDEAVLNDRLAGRLDVDVGDRIVVSAYGDSLELTVRDVIPEAGLAGYRLSEEAGFRPRSGGAPIFVAPGTVERLWEGSTAPGAAAPSAQVLVSNEGGVFDSADRTDEVVAAIEERVATVEEAEVLPVKEDLLDAAAESGASISELYAGIGAFSVIAGVLLLVNLFVMLAEERKTELGMLRAVGFKRSHIMRSFGIEGAVYASVAAVAGAILGIGVGWAITWVASGIIAAEVPEFTYTLVVQASSLVAGGVMGLVIALATVWVTSARISRLNIISAIRDLPEPRARRRQVRGIVLGSLGVLLGGVVLAAGLTGDDPYATLAGVPVVAFCLIPVLVRFLPRTPLVVGTSLVAISWAVLVFVLFPDAMAGSDIPVFVLMGVVLVGAAVAIATSVDHVWVALSDRFSSAGRGLSARLGLAYPLARTFRTGMLLGMYAIVIFTMTFMSVFTGIFTSQAPTFTEEVSAGYDVFVDSNPANPLTVEELEARPEVDRVAPLLQGLGRFSADVRPEETPWVVTGFDERLLVERPPALSVRLPEYGSDQEVFRALLEDDSLVVVDDFFLQSGGGPPEQLIDPGDVITMVHPSTGEVRELTVAAVMGSDWVFNGAFVGREHLEEFLGPLTSERRHYLALAEGADPDRVSDALVAELTANGADASSFRERVDRLLAQNESFFTLMRGYLGLGLLIGIAGLGVVMVRAVRERRREIGMLRAMGVPARTVRRAFLVEASFIALQGSLIGIGLGIVTSWMVLVNSSTFGDQRLPFSVPWLALALILVIPLVASIVATAAPATQAARIKPAAALRVAD